MRKRVLPPEDRCHLALRVHFFDLFEFPFDKQSAGFCLCSSLYGAVRQKENHSLRISNSIQPVYRSASVWHTHNEPNHCTTPQSIYPRRKDLNVQNCIPNHLTISSKNGKVSLQTLPFFFLPKIVKFSKLYSKTALRIPISVGAFKIFCKTAFLWFYKWKSNKIYILKLGSSTKFENQVAKHPFQNVIGIGGCLKK